MTGERIGHDATVADPGRVDAVGVDVCLERDLLHHGPNEADVVDILLRWLPATSASGIPGGIEAVGVGDQEMLLVCLFVPAVSALRLSCIAIAAVQHHHQRRTPQQIGWLVDDIGALDAVDRDCVCRRADWQRCGGGNDVACVSVSPHDSNPSDKENEEQDRKEGQRSNADQRPEPDSV